MSKPKPTPAAPELDPDQTRNPIAQPRVDDATEEELVARDIKHARSGHNDPLPSVRKAFADAVPVPEEGAKAAPSDVYRGPFVQQHKIRFTDPRTGKPVFLPHRMPLPDGGYGRRVVQPGDLPDDLAQDLWAQGALALPPPPQPKPRRPRA